MIPNLKNRRRRNRSAFRKALTLVELLVVISILGLLTTVTVRALGPGLEGARTREATRILSAALTRARYRAMETGRPAGLRFTPLASTPDAALQLVFVEEPPMYAGDLKAARMEVLQPEAVGGGTIPNGTNPIDAQWTVNITPLEADGSMARGDASSGLVGRGDRLTLGFGGAVYLITSELTPGSDPGEWTFDVRKDVEIGWGPKPAETFQIRRSPIPSAISPVSLSAGAVVDLGLSGIGDTGTFTIPSTVPITIMFSPIGNVDRIFHEGALAGEPVLRPIYLLVGLLDRVQSLANAGETNLDDFNTRWITISSQSGLIATYENAEASTLPAGAATAIEDARKSAITRLGGGDYVPD